MARLGIRTTGTPIQTPLPIPTERSGLVAHSCAIAHSSSRERFGNRDRLSAHSGNVLKWRESTTHVTVSTRSRPTARVRVTSRHQSAEKNWCRHLISWPWHNEDPPAPLQDAQIWSDATSITKVGTFLISPVGW